MNTFLPAQNHQERYASVRARMQNGFARKMNRAKGAKRANATIRASGRIPGQEARAARKANCAKRREEKAQQAAIGKQWRYGAADTTGV